MWSQDSKYKTINLAYYNLSYNKFHPQSQTTGKDNLTAKYLFSLP